MPTAAPVCTDTDEVLSTFFESYGKLRANISPGANHGEAPTTAELQKAAHAARDIFDKGFLSLLHSPGTAQTENAKLSNTQAVAMEHAIRGACSLTSRTGAGSSICVLHDQGRDPKISLQEALSEADECCKAFKSDLTEHEQNLAAEGKKRSIRYISNACRKAYLDLCQLRLPLLLSEVISVLQGLIIKDLAKELDEKNEETAPRTTNTGDELIFTDLVSAHGLRPDSSLTTRLLPKVWHQREPGSESFVDKDSKGTVIIRQATGRRVFSSTPVAELEGQNILKRKFSELGRPGLFPAITCSPVLGPVAVIREPFLGTLHSFLVWLQGLQQDKYAFVDFTEDLVASTQTSKYDKDQKISLLCTVIPHFSDKFVTATLMNAFHTYGVTGSDFEYDSESLHRCFSPFVPLGLQEGDVWCNFRLAFLRRPAWGRVNSIVANAVGCVIAIGANSYHSSRRISREVRSSILGPLEIVLSTLIQLIDLIDDLHKLGVSHNSLSPSAFFLVDTDTAHAPDSTAATSANPPRKKMKFKTINCIAPEVKLGVFRTIRNLGKTYKSPRYRRPDHDCDSLSSSEFGRVPSCDEASLPISEPAFMAPELAEFILNSEPSSTFTPDAVSMDIYSYGCVLEVFMEQFVGHRSAGKANPKIPLTPAGQNMRKRPELVTQEDRPRGISRADFRSRLSDFRSQVSSERHCETETESSRASSPDLQFGLLSTNANSCRGIYMLREALRSATKFSSGLVEVDIGMDHSIDLFQTHLYSISTGLLLCKDSEEILQSLIIQIEAMEKSKMLDIGDFLEMRTPLQRYLNPMSYCWLMYKTRSQLLSVSDLTLLKQAVLTSISACASVRKACSRISKIALACMNVDPKTRPSAKELKKDLAAICKSL